VINLEGVDSLYETVPSLQFAIFDKKVLLPLSQLPGHVKTESGQEIEEHQIRAMAAEGWFDLLPGAGEGGDEDGVPLYVPSRIGLLLKLQQEGWETDELRAVADLEDFMIDNILTVDDFAYSDDDLETLISQALGRVDSFETGFRLDAKGEPIDQTADLAKAQSELAFLRRLQREGIPSEIKGVVKKAAFRARAVNDMIRVQLLDMDRAKMTAGYGPLVAIESRTWNAVGGLEVGPVRWKSTVRDVIAYGKSNTRPPIRVPGFLLKGERIVSTRTLRPGDYANQWRQLDLDAYLAAWAEVSGERRCLNCLASLPATADERKQFCDEKCRNAAKQRRFRERNPVSVERTQKKYWESLDGLS